VLYALSAGQKTGLALVAAAFVAFALASSFWFSRRRPEFPGRGLRLFIAVSILLTIGMLGTVIALAKEKEHKEVAPETTTTSTSPQPAPPGPTPPPPAPAAKGDPAAGKALFQQNGCGSCHTYGPAGSNGKVGPDLDHVAADAQKAGQPLDAYAHQSIADPNAYIVPGFPSGVMPKFQLSAKQIDDLVAFVTQKS